MNTAMKDALHRATRIKFAQDEAKIRALLSHWASELEPAVVYRGTEIIGLTAEGQALGTYPYVFNPFGEAMDKGCEGALSGPSV